MDALFQSSPRFLLGTIVLASLWIGEACVPFYIDHRRASFRVGHDLRNLCFGVFNAAIVAILFSAAFAFTADWAQRNQFGLIHHIPFTAMGKALLAFVLIDFWMYVWHRANHAIPWLWRFHRMHHSDSQMDASTGVRFHTGEVVISALLRLLLIPTLGLTIGWLIVYEAVFFPIVLLQHSNVRLPRWLDYGLLAVAVTPAMHRVHHSRRRVETDSNYGSVFPYWDVLFRTMCLRSDARHIQLGLGEVDEFHSQTIRGMFLSPRDCGSRAEFRHQQPNG